MAAQAGKARQRKKEPDAKNHLNYKQIVSALALGYLLRGILDFTCKQNDVPCWIRISFPLVVNLMMIFCALLDESDTRLAKAMTIVGVPSFFGAFDDAATGAVETACSLARGILA